jgi:DedD protein
MAFFKFRLPGQTTSEPQGNHSNTPAESVDAMRRRARHRLIGASVLVIVGVVGFPLLFDTQPRPVSVDIAVDIPDRATAKPLVDTSKQKPLSAAAGLDAKEEVVPDVKAQAKSEPEPKAEVKPEAKPEAKAEAKPEVKPETKPEVADAKPTDTKDAGPRFVVQVGAFNDETKVREVRAKVEKEGIKTYTNVAQTKDGARTRVRVGPFTSRDEAEKVARKIKQLQLQPQVLTL